MPGGERLQPLGVAAVALVFWGHAEGLGSLIAVPKTTFAAPGPCWMRTACCGPHPRLGRFFARMGPFGRMQGFISRVAPRLAEKPGDSCRTSGYLSTEKGAAGQLFAQAVQQRNSCGTGLSLRQMPVALAKNGLVHKKAAPLLLPLCIHRTIKEQPGTTGVLRRRPCLCPQRGVV